MANVSRIPTRAVREDGSDLGGPGPAPRQPEPKVIHVFCPGCARAAKLDPYRMALKLWNREERGDGETEIAKSRKRAYDAIEANGWDVRCRACGAEFRVLYALDEWGKMSGAFFPAVYEVLHSE